MSEDENKTQINRSTLTSITILISTSALKRIYVMPPEFFFIAFLVKSHLFIYFKKIV